MKKIIFLTFLLLISCISMNAQQRRKSTTSKNHQPTQVNHLQLAGLPITGTYESFLKSLSNKGFKTFPQNKNTDQYDAIGTLFGINNWKVYIGTENNIVKGVSILKKAKDNDEAFFIRNNIISNITFKYPYVKKNGNTDEINNKDIYGNYYTITQLKLQNNGKLLGNVVITEKINYYYKHYSLSEDQVGDSSEILFLINFWNEGNQPVNEIYNSGNNWMDMAPLTQNRQSLYMQLKDFYIKCYIPSIDRTFYAVGKDRQFIANTIISKDISTDLKKYILSSYIATTTYLKQQNEYDWDGVIYSDLCNIICNNINNNSSKKQISDTFHRWIISKIFSPEELKVYDKLLGKDLENSILDAAIGITGSGSGKSNYDLLDESQKAYMYAHPNDSY